MADYIKKLILSVARRLILLNEYDFGGRYDR
jgi:hypothetical protein